MFHHLTIAGIGLIVVELAFVTALLVRSPKARRRAFDVFVALLTATGVLAAGCMTAIVLAAHASAGTTPTVFVHRVAGHGPNGGTWAWTDDPAVATVVEAAAPSVAAAKLSRLEAGDVVALTGRMDRSYRVLAVADRLTLGYDVAFAVTGADGVTRYVLAVAA